MSLPPDPENLNNERAEWAHCALDLFAGRTGLSEADTKEGTTLADLLADLMHWCDRYAVDFNAMLERARNHYEEETKADE